MVITKPGLFHLKLTRKDKSWSEDVYICNPFRVLNKRVVGVVLGVYLQSKSTFSDAVHREVLVNSGESKR